VIWPLIGQADSRTRSALAMAKLDLVGGVDCPCYTITVIEASEWCVCATEPHNSLHLIHV
jgi:hypothetical protein